MVTSRKVPGVDISLSLAVKNAVTANNAVVFGTLSPNIWKSFNGKSGITWNASNQTLTMPMPHNAGFGKVINFNVTSNGMTDVVWRVQVPGKSEVLLFSNHGYAVLKYGTDDMVTIANPHK